VTVLPALSLLGLISPGISAHNLITLQSLISTTTLIAMLTISARTRDFTNQITQFKLAQVELELAAESERRHEKELFLSMLTHELRNPLALIRLMARPEGRTGGSIQKAAREMEGIIERVELSERLKDANLKLTQTEMEFPACLDSVLVAVPYAERIDCRTAGDLFVTTDAGLVTAILRNLMDNAAKYGPSTARISLQIVSETRDARRGLAFNVINPLGEAGWPDPNRLFTKYYRSKGAHRQPGSGLGLFLVSRWATALGGTVSYKRSLSPDCIIFTFWVPQ
jgi:signal transduction histidine kinase